MGNWFAPSQIWPARIVAGFPQLGFPNEQALVSYAGPCHAVFFLLDEIYFDKIAFLKNIAFLLL